MWHEGGIRLLIQKIRRRLRISYFDLFAHQMPRGLPSVLMEVKYIEASQEDVLIAKRILTSAGKALKDEKDHAKSKSYVDAWDDLREKSHDKLSEIISSGEARRLADYLANVHMREMTYGISGSAEEYKQIASNARLKKEMGGIIKDILVSFAEALCILPYEVIVPYVAKKNIYKDSDLLIDEIEKKIGISIAPPDIDGGLFKLALKKGFFHERDLWSLYAAWRIGQIADKNSSICEIGAGIGKAAMYASRFGFENYSIFDLPLMNVIQAWYLIKTLPDKKITLYGETEDSKDSVKIMPSWEFAKTDKRYGLVLNQDSFPEISKDVVEDYLRKIKKCTKYFLSINHEHQAPLFSGTDKRNLVVPSLVEESGGFKRIYRFPFWLRKGYAEELYEIT
ncbi:MAG: hypothetical protein UW92_C0031G0004 [Candidatus Jorgensenbacteria bacterium GW2011_GWA2_45_13]|uniref:Sugar O-methyltransferase n=1 Tax=Candidatus Jorgensenbacteria bacterium GW2011_GWA2_45_13 TaxID=1618662 RepID=A0A0G1NC29_9BACT|nr:MAG: hypothetical protein UW92_C0031G0004 [Candidatus Jorgensenbacteria bacterium GW2011_GWA2_45_13]